MKTRKLIAILMTILMTLTATGVTAFASGMTPVSSSNRAVDLAQQGGKLMITEPGSYVLTGKLTGTVYVDPGFGEVELILDGVDINGKDAAGVIAVSGELKVTLPEGSVSRITDMNSNTQQYAAIYSKVPTTFEGEGSLYVTGSCRDAICVENNDIFFNGGAYAIKAPRIAINASGIQLNDGHFSIQAQNSFSPDAQINCVNAVVEEVQPVVMAEIQNNGSRNQNLIAASSTVPSDENANRTDNTQRADSAAPSESASPSQENVPTNPTNQVSANTRPDENIRPENSRPDNTPQMDSSARQEMNAPFGQQTQLTSASDPTEIVAGTMTNSAASLEADYENATYITVTDDDSQVKITSSGTYVVLGSSSDGNITVKKGTTGVVLVLEDLDLTSTTGATVSVNKEAEVKIIISGNVVLTDNENPDDEDSEDEEVADAFDGAALKVKANANVYVTGDGTLTINGNAKNGIKGGDEASLIFDGVTVNINAVNDGINVNYDVTLLSGNFTIAAGDDAIHADHILTIGSEDGEGPTIKVTSSNEGLEGTVVNIYGGDISIVSSDDAINAANGDGLYEGVLDYSFNMMGGRLVINSQGDGIDSNGNVNLMGGSAEIHSGSQGGEAGIDYDGQLYVSDDFQLNNQSGTAGPDGMGGMPGDMSGVPGQMDGQSFDGQMPTQMDGQNFGGQMPTQMDGQNFGGQMPTQMDGQNFGGQMPTQMDGQNFGGQMPTQMDGQNFGGQMPTQMDGQNFGGQMPTQMDGLNFGGQMPNNEMIGQP